MSTEEILADYDRLCDLHAQFLARLQQLLRELLVDTNVAVQTVSGRIKDRNSLQRKLRKPTAMYVSLGDITDVIGLRIICFFAEDVDRIARLIESEFDVDTEHTTDKRKLLDPDRFGYLSFHHVVRLGVDRIRLSEYKRFANIKAEIQTRSVLQHAWAEIEHDLGYKATIQVPQHVRRRFSIVAGLLELADREFVDIRAELERYEKVVSAEIVTAPENVSLDALSLMSFAKKERLVAKLDREIATLYNGAKFVAAVEVEYTLNRLRLAGLDTIAAVRDALNENKDRIVPFAREWLKLRGSTDGSVVHGGISLFYLPYVLIARSSDLGVIKAFMQRCGLGDAVDNLIAAWRRSGA